VHTHGGKLILKATPLFEHHPYALSELKSDGKPVVSRIFGSCDEIVHAVTKLWAIVISTINMRQTRRKGRLPTVKQADYVVVPEKTASTCCSVVEMAHQDVR
jgi:hypothetical protein